MNGPAHPPVRHRLIAAALATSLLTLPLPAQQESFQVRPGRELPAFALDNERRIDPEYDAWRSEALHDAAKPVLKQFFHDLAEGHDFASVTFAQDFQCSVLRPDLETVHNDGTIAVRRAAVIPAERYGLAELARLAQEFRAAVPADAALGTFVLKLVSVQLDAADRFRIRAYLHTHAAAPGLTLQWNVELETFWTVISTDQDLALSGVELIQYEEVLGPAGLLPDYAQQVFAATPDWSTQILTGTEAWTARVDKLFGRSFLGTQGLAVGDVDGDGRDDLYFCQQAGLPNRLWLSRDGGAAEEVSARMGVDFLDKTRSALIADFDNDGRQDLAISFGMDVALCWNTGDGRFETARVRGSGNDEIYSIAAADADGDGDLDLYACRYISGGLLSAVPSPYHDATNGAKNVFWRNEGAREFRVATDEVGLGHDNNRFSLAAVWEDLDDDGDADLYVVNDFGRNCLYLNEGGKFRNVAAERNAEDLSAGMGATIADADGDGDLDIYVTNMFSSAGRRIATQDDRFMQGGNQDLHQYFVRHARGNSLLLNDGNAHFTDATDQSGAATGLWGWGSLFFELDNDGLPDIYAPNGFLTNPEPDDL
ncbi:MAG: VCBS repeat-containing protein [Planctomycetota bacterium]|nr:VCBS repeat-containing protein [Planctomycetota bacterium]